MTVGPGDALFGQDGTGGDATSADATDGLGMLPGLDLPVVRLPSIGPDGEIVGLDDLDHDLLGPDPEPADRGPAGGVAPDTNGVRTAGPDSTTGAWAPEAAAPSVGTAGADAAASRGRRDGDGSAWSAPPGRDRPGWGPAGSRAATTSPVVGRPTPARSRYAPRPRVVDEPGILGLSRHSRGRLGSRLFTWFFVLVFSLILIQLVVALLAP